MRVNSKQAGFGLIETLMSMLLVGVILGIVARGYQAMSRLNLATYQMSQRMELSAFLQRLSFEVSSALTISTTPNGFVFQRIDPTFNLEYEEKVPVGDPLPRLPWPIPPAIPTDTPLNLLLPAYRVSVEYAFDADTNTIRRTSYDQTTIQAVSVGEFTADLEQGGRILALSAKPKEMTSAVKTRILLPVVRP